jgi:anaphase-promoting complex subunit 2
MELLKLQVETGPTDTCTVQPAHTLPLALHLAGKFIQTHLLPPTERALDGVYSESQLKDLTAWLYHEYRRMSGALTVMYPGSGVTGRLKAVFKVTLLDEVESNLKRHLLGFYHGTYASHQDFGLTVQLFEVGWADQATVLIWQVVKAKLTEAVERQENPQVQMLENITGLIDSQITGWLNRLLGWNPSCEHELQGKVRSAVYKLVGKKRIAQMFDIILDFPDTKPALHDLALCLANCDLTNLLESHLKAEFARRVANLSKQTEGILLIYINLTKVMKQLFPTIEVLESVSVPLKEELRKRSDTFKCIIKSISEDPELYSLLDIKQSCVKEVEDFSSDEDEAAAAEWNPIPRSVVRSAISSINKRNDIVSMLINIYGSQEQFMDDYRNFLSRKLISNAKFDVNDEIKDIEMLKKRFGEFNVHKCEVMIQDVLSSKRINGYIHEEPSEDATLALQNLNCLIVSSYFWPLEEGEFKFKMPEPLATTFSQYTARFSVCKASRKLKFHEMLGKVSLTLEFENGSKTWDDVSPLHAAMISLFDGESSRKSAEEIAEALEVPVSLIKKEVSFWESKGVLVKEREADVPVYRAATLTN